MSTQSLNGVSFHYPDLQNHLDFSRGTPIELRPNPNRGRDISHQPRGADHGANFATGKR